MKNKFKILIAGVALLVNVNILMATTWTVSNYNLKPAQYTTVQAAINVAVPGDTILVAGSPNNYDIFDVNRQLVIIGEGANNPDGFNTNIYSGSSVILSNFNNTIGASGSKIIGLNFTYPWSWNISVNGNFAGQLAGENLIQNITVERCQFSGNGIGFTSQIYKNFIIRNCVFTGTDWTLQFQTSSVENIIVTNCVFSSCYIYANPASYNLNGNVVIRNSVFINRTANVFNAKGLVVENCIFYRALPQGATSSVFNNNITYLNNDNSLIYSDNIGSGNIIGVDPKFVNFPMLGGAFAWTYDFGLQAGSPALGTGTNSTDIGLTGGNSPVNQIPGNSRLPVVTTITIPVSSVPVGGTLQINVTAKTRK